MFSLPLLRGLAPGASVVTRMRRCAGTDAAGEASEPTEGGLPCRPRFDALRGAAASAWLLVVLFAVALPSVPGEGQAREVTVMTRNMYLGTGLGDPVATWVRFLAADLEHWAEVKFQTTSRRARPSRRWRSRTSSRPVGLQEVADLAHRSRATPPSTARPATTVDFDFLDLLLDELAALGLALLTPWKSRQRRPGGPHARRTSEYERWLPDVRLTHRDVILVNDDNPNLVIARAATPAT